MKLTQEHKNILKSMGETEDDFAQIEEATGKTTYTLCDAERMTSKRIGIKRAIELLGIKDFLSGLSRSAFHWSAARTVESNPNQTVLFDSSRLFK